MGGVSRYLLGCFQVHTRFSIARLFLMLLSTSCLSLSSCWSAVTTTSSSITILLNNAVSLDDSSALKSIFPHISKIRYPQNLWKDYKYPYTDPTKRANAVIILLARNEDQKDLLKVLNSFETHINSRYGYPYLFFNDEEFTDSFKGNISRSVSSPVTFVKLAPEYWDVPDFIDMDKLNLKLQEKKINKVLYGDMLSYLKMCRFFSGPLFKHPEVLKYDYYWRLDSKEVEFYCQQEFDPFVYMEENNLVYGFTISLHELMNTIPTLWTTIRTYMEKVGPNIAPGSWMNYFTEDDRGDYNGLHFWSNFEIGSVKFFANKTYQDYFEYLDRAGGFFYERWGDAPVHSLALGMFVDKKQVYYFNEIGYRHQEFGHCPIQPELMRRCTCTTDSRSIDFEDNSGKFPFLNQMSNTIEGNQLAVKETMMQLRILLLQPTSCDSFVQIGNDKEMYHICATPAIEDYHCVVFSFAVKGARDNFDLEQDMVKQHNCRVYYFNQWVKVSDAVDTEIRIYQINLAEADDFSQRRSASHKLFFNDMRLSTIRASMREPNIDILKFDVEGNEWAVLCDMLESDALVNVKFLIIELHLDRTTVWYRGLQIARVLNDLMKMFELVEMKANHASDTLGDWGYPDIPRVPRLVLRNRFLVQ